MAQIITGASGPYIAKNPKLFPAPQAKIKVETSPEEKLPNEKAKSKPETCSCSIAEFGTDMRSGPGLYLECLSNDSIISGYISKSQQEWLLSTSKKVGANSFEIGCDFQDKLTLGTSGDVRAHPEKYLPPSLETNQLQPEQKFPGAR